MTHGERWRHGLRMAGWCGFAQVVVVGIGTWLLMDLAVWKIVSRFLPKEYMMLIVVIMVMLEVVASLSMWIIRGLKNDGIDYTLSTMGPVALRALAACIEEELVRVEKGRK